MRIESYDFKVKYLAGKKVCFDPRSRSPFDIDKSEFKIVISRHINLRRPQLEMKRCIIGH